MGVCAAPVICSSLVSTAQQSHSMAVFNSLLIKWIEMLCSPCSNCKYLCRMAFTALPEVLCGFDGLFTGYMLDHVAVYPFLGSDCLFETDSRGTCQSHLARLVRCKNFYTMHLQQAMPSSKTRTVQWTSRQVSHQCGGQHSLFMVT